MDEPRRTDLDTPMPNEGMGQTGGSSYEESGGQEIGDDPVGRMEDPADRLAEPGRGTGMEIGAIGPNDMDASSYGTAGLGSESDTMEPGDDLGTDDEMAVEDEGGDVVGETSGEDAGAGAGRAGG